MNRKPLGLYIHIPFCVRKCRYCDFLSFGAEHENSQYKEEYVKALETEIASYGKWKQDYIVQTIYFGGGTPSFLKPELVEQILLQIRKTFVISEQAEITLECNPGTTTLAHFQKYKEYGVNRLSIGLQSTNDEMLKRLGRVHTFSQFEKQYEQARQVGFTNINVDLMSALPGQTMAMYEEDIKTVIALQPEHISSYGLIIEEGTPFANDAEVLSKLPIEEVAVAMYELTGQMLEEAGYHRYEISNYAKPGYESRHNSSYWTGIEYVGIGLGASSYFQNQRFHNAVMLQQYIEHPENSHEDVETMTKKDRMEECMFLGLRRMCGVSFSEFEQHFQIPIMQVYGDVIHKYVEQKLLYIYEKNQEQFVALTKQGIMVSNQVFVDFML